MLFERIVQGFPFIKNIEVLSPGGTPGIYATLADKSVRSLSLISSGIHKTVSLYCGLAELKNGLMLIDELENGIYYERYGMLWRDLVEMTTSLDLEGSNQLFVSTHSLECLKSLAPVLENNIENFALFRMERVNNDCIARRISGQAMLAALNGEVDLRGSVYAE